MSSLVPNLPASALATLLLLAGCEQSATTASTGSTDQSAAADADPAPDRQGKAGQPGDPADLASQNKRLCTADEDIVFSCQLDNRKIASICATRNEAGDSVAQYRYGSAGEIPELTWPDVESGNGLQFASVPYSGGGEAQLHFRRGDAQYVVYSRVIRTNFTAGEPNDPALEDGLFVRQGDRIVARHSCSDQDSVPIDYDKAARYADQSDGDIVVFDH